MNILLGGLQKKHKRFGLNIINITTNYWFFKWFVLEFATDKKKGEWRKLILETWRFFLLKSFVKHFNKKGTKIKSETHPPHQQLLCQSISCVKYRIKYHDLYTHIFKIFIMHKSIKLSLSFLHRHELFYVKYKWLWEFENEFFCKIKALRTHAFHMRNGIYIHLIMKIREPDFKKNLHFDV